MPHGRGQRQGGSNASDQALGPPHGGPARSRDSSGAGASASGAAFHLRAEQIEPVFQPIVDLSRGEVAGFETLSRPGAGSGFTNVGELFEWAESNQVLWQLEEVTRQAGLQAAINWPDGVLLFINSSPRVFADARFAQAISRAVKRVPGLAPGRVVLEITERSEQQYIDGLEEQVKLLKDFGFQVAIDDVGAGASGLNRIMALRPQWLKLDRELVDGIDRDRARQNLLRFFLHFARLSAVRLVAEGIEREAELATLIDLGVPYAQGFLLGRPGSRHQSLSPELSEWIRRRWQEAEGTRFRDPERLHIGQYSRPAETVRGSEMVSDVAGRLLRQLGTPGLAVLDGGRFVGWCDRDQVLRAAGDVRASHPVGYLVAHDSTTASPDTAIAEALDIALCRDDRHVATPLVLSERGRVVGVVSVRDMLHAAITMANQSHLRAAPLTGLPGRVRSDEHLAELFERDRSSLAAPALADTRTFDAAFVDIRNFNDYNGAMGYDLGDLLLKRLTGMIQQLVVRSDTGVFVGHLGDDRFLLTAPGGVLGRRAQALVRQFDRAVQEQAGERAPGSAETAAVGGYIARGTARIGLRVLVFPGAFRQPGGVHALHRRAEHLRAKANALSSPTQRPGVGAESASIVMVDGPSERPFGEARSA